MNTAKQKTAVKYRTISEDTTLTAADVDCHFSIDTRQHRVTITLPESLPAPGGYIFHDAASSWHVRPAEIVGISIGGQETVCKLDVCHGAAMLYWHGKRRGWELSDVS